MTINISTLSSDVPAQAAFIEDLRQSMRLKFNVGADTLTTGEHTLNAYEFIEIANIGNQTTSQLAITLASIEGLQLEIVDN